MHYGKALPEYEAKYVPEKKYPVKNIHTGLRFTLGRLFAT
jgi:hypothetical protein